MNELSNYGILGIIVIALSGYIIRLEIKHAKERKEWNDMMNKHLDRMDRRDEDTNKIIRENTGILAGLKTLLEQRTNDHKK